MRTAANAEITNALKGALKSKGMTYREVAEKLDLSEKTIKRLFRDKDCSLTRLNDICDLIDLSIFDLLDFAKNYNEPLAKLSYQQQVYLGENPYHFNFLILLTTEHPIEQIQTTYGLSDVSVFRYLRDLDREGLIELGPNNSYKLRIQGKLLMQLHGPVHHNILQKNEQFLNYVVQHDGEKGTQFSSAFRFMSEHTLMALNQDLANLSRQYRKQAYQDESFLPKDKLIPVKWTTLVSPFNICGEWELPELER
ncbi:helix-turn-helix domain-containing protein [Marinomonas sp. PE14-40]|uniref:helix-turn-helix domain-containing protein n=1 Tax=Marinomonas sp. PE14-40 TaxID=3060621 RepID=UPI003F672833